MDKIEVLDRLLLMSGDELMEVEKVLVDRSQDSALEIESTADQ